MDVTSEYVKQCEKAVEIQNKSPRKDFMDLEFSSGVYFSPDGNRWFRKMNGDRVYIWLPRQDDLQGMIKGEPAAVLVNLGEWAQSNEMGNINTTSYEQLWLAFVMKEYGKVWNGEEWVR